MPKKQSSSKTKKEKITRSKKDKSEKTKSVVFKIYCPDAKQVYLAGDFNGWDESSLPMIRREDGVWEISQDLKPGEYQYKYLVDGNWQTDSQQEMVANQFGTMNNIIRIEE
jgi:1,4-alpha-glucan branching enzyme